MDVGDLSVAMAKAFQSALVDQAACSDSFDFFEDRSGTRMELQPRVPASAPTQVFLHDAMHCRRIAALKLKNCCQDNVTADVKDALVVAELHVVTVYNPTLSLLRQDHCRVEHISDEHGALAFRLRLEEMQVLPDSTSDGAGNSDVMFEPRPASLDGLWNDLANN